MSKLEKISNLNRNVSSGPLPVSTDLATVGQVDVAGLYANSIQPMAASKVKVDTTSAAAESVNTATEAPLLSATIVIVGDKVSGAANDVLHGTDGNDSIYGGNGSDTLYGYSGQDTLYGGAGVDYLYGGDFADTLQGGKGNDFLYAGDSEIVGYLADTADFSDHYGSVSKGWNINLVTQIATTTDSVNGVAVLETDILSRIYSAIGSAGNDTFTVGDGHSVYGGAGTDAVVLTPYFDGINHQINDYVSNTLSGGISYGYALQGETRIALRDIEVFYLGDGRDGYNGGSGDISSAVATTVYGEAGKDELIGGALNDKLYGGADDDILSGGGGNDLVNGGEGNDRILGAEGRDTLVGGNGADTFYFNSSANTLTNADTITDFVHLVDKLQLEAWTFSALGGSLDTTELRIGTAALDGNDYLVYDQARGKLYFDADGNGSIAKELVVTLTKNTLLTVDDFAFL